MNTNERFAKDCGVATNRWSDAVAIQAGACNPSGVARALVRAINACLAENMDTDAIRSDAAVRLIVHQLAHLTNQHAVEYEMNIDGTVYDKLTAEIERKATEVKAALIAAREAEAKAALYPKGWDKVD